MITKPILPPRAGYVEVVDSEGRHVYKPTPETLKAREAEADRVSYAELAAAIREGVNSIE